MEFLKRFFKKKEDSTINTTMDLLPSILENNLNTKRKIVELESAKKMSELKYLFEKTNALLNKIKNQSLEEKTNEKLNRAAITSKKQIEKQLEKILEKIQPNFEFSNLEKTYAYSKESFVFLFNEINSYRKSIIYTSIYLKEEMKELGNILQDILNKLKEMNELFDNEKEIFYYEKTKNSINNININLENIKIDKNQINVLTEEIEKDKSLILKKETETNELLESEESKQLEKFKQQKSDLLNKKQSLKVELMSMISVVEKPLQKFLSLIESGRHNIDKSQQELLQQFLTNPLVALKSDIDGKIIKTTLGEVIKAINNKKIELKEKEQEKKLDALNELVAFDYFGKIFWKINEIQREINQIDFEITKKQVIKKIAEKEKEMQEIKLNLTKKNEEIIYLNNRIKSTEKKVEDDKKKIIDFSKNVLNKNIIIE